MSLYTNAEDKTSSPLVSLKARRDPGRRLAPLVSFFVGILVALFFGGNAFGGTPWVAPLGIPTPSWPAELNIDRPTLPSNWTSDQAGYYFIESSGCSDSRTYGFPAAPRCNLPSSPAAGSVIVLNGTISGNKSLSFSGTYGSPIWILAYNTATKPVATGTWSISGSYKILDSIAFSNGAQDGNLGLGGSYNMVRSCTFVNTYSTSNGSVIGGGGNNNVLYRITISQAGNWQHTGSDIDRHGIKVGGSDLWIVDSIFYHCQGDGIQIGDQNNSSSAINRIYIGRNTAYENLQSCFWTKNASDIIFSQNTCHDIVYSPGGDGQGIGGQYDARYVWFLGNTIFNTKSGIKISGSSNGGGGPWYAIGNLIYNVDADGSCNNYNVGGIAYRNEGGMFAFFNTLYNVDMFLAAPSGGTLTARNNIFANKQGSCSATGVSITFNHDYNLWSSSAYVPGTETHGIVGDPKFISAGSNFALQPNSPALGNANTSVEAAFSTYQSRYGADIRYDIIGNSRPASPSDWTIGAYQYTSESGMSPPRSVRIINAK